MKLKTNIESYLVGKKWYHYLPLWLVCIYIFFKILSFSPSEPQSFFIAIPQAFDFFLHEMAHIITAFLPSILTAAAGSFSELLLGVLLIITAFKTKGYFASVICFLWFMLACQSVGIYMADARSQNLDLVSLGGELSGSDHVIHDWNYVFGKLHILPLDKFIGGSVRAVGILAGLFGLCFGAWLMYQMAARADSKGTKTTT